MMGIDIGAAMRPMADKLWELLRGIRDEQQETNRLLTKLVEFEQSDRAERQESIERTEREAADLLALIEKRGF